MYFSRKIDAVLQRWSRSPDPKPLVLRGARQTGKSSSVRRFGEMFDLFVELNLERSEDLRLVRACNSVQELLAAIAVREDVAEFPSRTLLFLDEIQEAPEAIGWLRFLREDHPELHVVAAGSLLEVRLQERGFSFPVGRVTFRNLYPLSFFEFLEAVDRSVLAQTLRESVAAGTKLPGVLHQEALRQLGDYLWVGGMPEAVTRWVETANPAAVREVQSDLLQALAEDIQKYRGNKDLDYLEAAFENLRVHYGQRFRYENFAPGFKSREMKAALGKLEMAMILTRAWPTSSLALPLQVRARSTPKLLPLDVGLAAAVLLPSYAEFLAAPLEQMLSGRLVEMFVGQQLLTTLPSYPNKLHFWVSESARNNAEVDFLLEVAGKPLPVEVKASATGALKSLHQFLWRAGLSTGVRFYSGPWLDERQVVKMSDGELHYRLLSLPLYLAEEILSLPQL